MIYGDVTSAQISRSDLRFWVELRGFEPLTPSMRTRCATGLRYSPKTGSQRTKPQGYAPPRGPRLARACVALRFGTLAPGLGAVAQSGSAPRSHRGGQWVKCPQLR